MAEEHLASEVTKRIYDYLESIYDSSDESLAEDEEPEPKRRLRTVYGLAKKINRLERENMRLRTDASEARASTNQLKESFTTLLHKNKRLKREATELEDDILPLNGDISRLEVERDEKEELLGLKAVEVDHVQKTAKSDVERLVCAQRALHNVNGNMERTLQQLE